MDKETGERIKKDILINWIIVGSIALILICLWCLFVWGWLIRWFLIWAIKEKLSWNNVPIVFVTIMTIFWLVFFISWIKLFIKIIKIDKDFISLIKAINNKTILIKETKICLFRSKSESDIDWHSWRYHIVDTTDWIYTYSSDHIINARLYDPDKDWSKNNSLKRKWKKNIENFMEWTGLIVREKYVYLYWDKVTVYVDPNNKDNYYMDLKPSAKTLDILYD